MARCGCTSGCACTIHHADTNCVGINITGSGSGADPYIISPFAKISLDAGNTISCHTDGLFVPIGFHDGVGAGSTYTILSANSPLAAGANSVAVGVNAVANDNETIAIGDSANTSGSAAIAIGQNSSTAGTGGGVAIGQGASALNVNTVAIGTSAQSTQDSSIAIGTSSVCSFPNAVAIGDTATVSQDSAIAIGQGATAANANAVALGDGVSTTNTSQVNIGTKRAFLGAPNSVTADVDLIHSQLTFYLNEADDTLVIKVKYSGGTVKTFLGALV